MITTTKCNISVHTPPYNIQSKNKQFDINYQNKNSNMLVYRRKQHLNIVKTNNLRPNPGFSRYNQN